MLYTYDPSIHDYSVDKPEFVNIGHDHWVYGNKKEIEEYRAIRERGIPVQAITIVEGEVPETPEVGAEEDTAADDQFLAAPVHDTGSFWYSVLSFLLPILGIIAAMIWKNHKHYRNYNACKRGAVAGFIFLAVVLVIFLLLIVAAVV